MTAPERDELIEKSLLNELDAASEVRVQQLRQEDDAFRQAYDFQKMIIQQVRLRRRQELLNMFADFEAEQGADKQDDTTPVIPFTSRVDHASTTTNSTVISLWRTGFRVAASVVVVCLLGAALWWQLATHDAPPVAQHKPDSTRTLSPTDTVHPKPAVPPVVPEPQGPVAHRPTRPARLQGPVRLPYYETDDVRLGFGKQQKTTAYQPVVFSVGAEAAYEFGDTLRVYLPTLPTAKPAWSLVYNRMTDTYYLQSGKSRYELIKGLAGRQPLVRTR